MAEAVLHRCAGTLTQNEMVVVRMWLAGQEFDNLQYLTNSGISSSSIDGRDPLSLDPRLHSLLLNSLALNTTASIEAGKSGESCVCTSITRSSRYRKYGCLGV